MTKRIASHSPHANASPYLGPESQDKFERYEWNLRVADVVATGLSDSDLPLQRRTRSQAASVMRALGDVRLRSLARRRFLTLSNGQRRRVLLARLLVRRPDLLLLDEVLNGLDARARKAFVATLERIASPRIAWMLSTHRPLEAPRNVTHRAHLDAGRLVHGRRGRDPRPGCARAACTGRTIRHTRIVADAHTCADTVTRRAGSARRAAQRIGIPRLPSGAAAPRLDTRAG
jgi:ABC-type Mn2+/Zn2+ transport system ATPase subunit